MGGQLYVSLSLCPDLEFLAWIAGCGRSLESQTAWAVARLYLIVTTGGLPAVHHRGATHLRICTPVLPCTSLHAYRVGRCICAPRGGRVVVGHQEVACVMHASHVVCLSNDSNGCSHHGTCNTSCPWCCYPPLLLPPTLAVATHPCCCHPQHPWCRATLVSAPPRATGETHFGDGDGRMLPPVF